MLGWIKRGGGYELYEKLLKKLNLDIKGFFAFPMPTQPLGWFKKKPPRGKEELKGFKYRTVGLAADLMQELGMKVTQLPGGEIIPLWKEVFWMLLNLITLRRTEDWELRMYAKIMH